MDEDSMTFLVNLFQCLVIFTIKKTFPDVEMESPVFQFVPITYGPVTGCHWRAPASIFVHTLHVIKHTGKLCVPSVCLPTHPRRFLLYRLNSPSSPSLSSYEMLQSLNHLSSPSFSSLHVSLVLGSTELCPEFQVWHHQCRAEGKDQLWHSV